MYRFANCSIWDSFEGDCLAFRQHFIESGKHLPNHALCNLVNILKSSVLLLQSPKKYLFLILKQAVQS
jgi:hypothetical protein